MSELLRRELFEQWLVVKCNGSLGKRQERLNPEGPGRDKLKLRSGDKAVMLSKSKNCPEFLRNLFLSWPSVLFQIFIPLQEW